MPSLTANGVKIEYEIRGSDNDPPILMIMGLSAQLVMWPPSLVQALVDAGFKVILFDNRDIGLSQKFDGRKPPNPLLQLMLRRLGVKLPAPYDLEDMATDARGLLDALGVEKAHIVGASMGGMIGQLFASIYPERTASLVPIMSGTNNPSLPRADPEVIRKVLLRRRQTGTKEQLLEDLVGVWSVIGTPGPDGGVPEETRQRLKASIDRCYYPPGAARQLAAIISTGDLRPYARSIKAPTLVVYGSIDPLARVEGSMDIERTVRGARLEIIEGMAHDLPTQHIPKISGLIVDHIRMNSEADRSSAPA